jgi:hypothetical protein
LLLNIQDQDSASETHSSQLPSTQLDLPGCSNLVTQPVSHSHSRGIDHGPVRSQQQGMSQVQLHSTTGQQEHIYAIIHHRLSQSYCTWDGGEGGAQTGYFDVTIGTD